MEVTLQLSKTRHQHRSDDAVRGARSRRSERKAVRFRINPASGDPDEFPPLPPVIDLKRAICRRKVGEGISYVLPVDKTKNSVENVFRTDLRVMFRDPYRSDAPRLYEERLRSLARHHFEPNRAGTEYDWKAKIVCRLNVDSERARRNFAKSAPATCGRRSLVSEKPRSVLFSPVAAFVQPEVRKLKQEADEIVKSVGLGASLDPERGAPAPAAADSVSPDARHPDSRPATWSGHARHLASAPPPIGGTTERKSRRKLPKMADDEPEAVRSPYLSELKNSDIWLWIQDRKAQPGDQNTGVRS